MTVALGCGEETQDDGRVASMLGPAPGSKVEADGKAGALEILAGALRLRPLVLLVAVGLLALAVTRVPRLGSEMLPEVRQGELFIDAFLPRDATVERTARVMTPVEARVAALEDVERTFLAAGVDDDELNDSDQGEHSARLLVRMKPTRDRAASATAAASPLCAMTAWKRRRRHART